MCLEPYGPLGDWASDVGSDIEIRGGENDIDGRSEEDTDMLGAAGAETLILGVIVPFPLLSETEMAGISAGWERKSLRFGDSAPELLDGVH